MKDFNGCIKPILFKMSTRDIDSDDDFVVCENCEKTYDLSEINRVILCTSKKIILCSTCKIWLSNLDALEKIKYDEDDDDADERLKNERLKVKKQKEENAKKLLTSQRIQQEKKRWEGLTIGTKIAELELQICHKIYPGFLAYRDEGLGQRLMLYENDRFKELQKTCPVIEQASRAIYNFIQPPHLQIENPYEKKDQSEKILAILEKWLEDIDLVKYNQIKGFPRAPPPPPFSR